MIKTKTLLIGVFIILFFLSCHDNESNEQFGNSNFTGKTISCGDFYITKNFSPENSKITLNIVGAGREKLNLSSEYKKFTLPNKNITVKINKWNKPTDSYFCNDVFIENIKALQTWNAISGNLRMKVSDITKNEFETYYKATIVLENIVLKNDGGGEQRITNLVIQDIGLGWFPG